MELIDKLKILADGAKYDVSCVSSGSNRKNTAGGIGSGFSGGICHSFAADGRCISLLKILMSNYCIYNCAYCVNRISNDAPRATFTPDEVADLTIGFYRRNYIEGLFLSSGVIKNPDYTMEQIILAVQKLRNEYRFNGYIHIKAIPGADCRLIEEAGRLVDRMSVNIELPTHDGLKLLAPQKKKEAILGPMSYIHHRVEENNQYRAKSVKAPLFVPAGQSTQLIVGATPDQDLKILKLSESLYKQYKLKRVFYSAYVPVNPNNPNLPAIIKPPLVREHRLYQADWLLRFYGFAADELLNENQPNFNIQLDPKCDWALRNLHIFPIEINKADYSMLLRVPGIGMRSAQRIVKARLMNSLGFDDLKAMGVVLKRARYFITCRGKYIDQMRIDQTFIMQNLLADRSRLPVMNSGYVQLSLLNSSQYQLPQGMSSKAELPALREETATYNSLMPDDLYSGLSGEL